jgi:hypothetical protein
LRLKLKLTNSGEVPLVLLATMVRIEAGAVEFRDRRRTRQQIVDAWREQESGSVYTEIDYGDRELLYFFALPYDVGSEVEPHSSTAWSDMLYVKSGKFDELQMVVKAFYCRGDRMQGLTDDGHAADHPPHTVRKVYRLDRESVVNTLVSGGGRVYADWSFDESTAEPDVDVSFEPYRLWSLYGTHVDTSYYYIALASAK